MKLKMACTNTHTSKMGIRRVGAGDWSFSTWSKLEMQYKLGYDVFCSKCRHISLRIVAPLFSEISGLRLMHHFTYIVV